MPTLSCQLCDREFETPPLSGWGVCPGCGHVQAAKAATKAAQPAKAAPRAKAAPPARPPAQKRPPKAPSPKTPPAKAKPPAKAAQPTESAPLASSAVVQPPDDLFDELFDEPVKNYARPAAPLAQRDTAVEQDLPARPAETRLHKPEPRIEHHDLPPLPQNDHVDAMRSTLPGQTPGARPLPPLGQPVAPPQQKPSSALPEALPTTEYRPHQNSEPVPLPPVAASPPAGQPPTQAAMAKPAVAETAPIPLPPVAPRQQRRPAAPTEAPAPAPIPQTRAPRPETTSAVPTAATAPTAPVPAEPAPRSAEQVAAPPPAQARESSPPAMARPSDPVSVPALGRIALRQVRANPDGSVPPVEKTGPTQPPPPPTARGNRQERAQSLAAAINNVVTDPGGQPAPVPRAQVSAESAGITVFVPDSPIMDAAHPEGRPQPQVPQPAEIPEIPPLLAPARPSEPRQPPSATGARVKGGSGGKSLGPILFLAAILAVGGALIVLFLLS